MQLIWSHKTQFSHIWLTESMNIGEKFQISQLSTSNFSTERKYCYLIPSGSPSMRQINVIILRKQKHLPHIEWSVCKFINTYLVPVPTIIFYSHKYIITLYGWQTNLWPEAYVLSALLSNFNWLPFGVLYTIVSRNTRNSKCQMHDDSLIRRHSHNDLLHTHTLTTGVSPSHSIAHQRRKWIEWIVCEWMRWGEME